VFDSGHLAADERFVVERRGHDRHPLRPCQKMQRQRLGPIAGTKCPELPGEPVAKQAEYFGRAALRDVIELSQFGRQGSDRAAEGHDLRPVGDQHMDEGQDALARALALGLPAIEIARVRSMRRTITASSMASLVLKWW